MALEFSSRFRRTVSIGVFAAAFGAMPGFSQSATYTVDGSTTLTTIASQIQGKTSGVLRVRFKSYQNVGQFSITSLSADSLIFERAEESAEAVEFTGKLFHFENVTTPVVFRNLAFKVNSGSSKFLEGYTLGSPNKALIIDSCLIFGDSLNTSFLSWLGGGSSKVGIQRTIIAGSKGQNPQVDLVSDTIRITNSYLNFSGLVSATTVRKLELMNLTTNRVQFELNGKGTSLFSFRDNVFGHPPGDNKLPGGTNKFVMYLLGFGTGTSFNDVRFSSWFGFDVPGGTDAHSDPSNVIQSPFGDTASLWNFRNPIDSTRGYSNPASTRFPAFNVFPADSVFGLRLSAKDTISVSFTSAKIPRVITGSYGSTSYPSVTDSTRTLWFKDTTLQITGPVSIRSIAFPRSQAQGTPLLFYQSGSNFIPGSAGLEGGNMFSNTQASARVFIPSFSSQNTFKGVGISVKGISADTSLTFATITRAGRTSFQTSNLSPNSKRWRMISIGGKVFGFKDTTNAEGSGDVQFGFSKTGADTPFLPDSLTWWLGGISFSPVSDSAGKFRGKTSFAPSIQAQLIERLAAGKGVDTVPLLQGRIITSSLTGHQLKVDSSYQPDQIQFPDMGSFSKGISFTWAGRGSGDSFALTLNKSNKLQKVYAKNGSSALLLSPIKEDSASLTVSFGIGDSGKVVFLAMLKGDTVNAIRQTAPGVLPGLPTALRIGGLRLPWGNDAVSGRIQLYEVGGRLMMDAIISREASLISLQNLGDTPLLGWWTVNHRSGGARQTQIRIPSPTCNGRCP